MPGSGGLRSTRETMSHFRPLEITRWRKLLVS
jgi:hypothetical protein